MKSKLFAATLMILLLTMGMMPVFANTNASDGTVSSSQGTEIVGGGIAGSVETFTDSDSNPSGSDMSIVGSVGSVSAVDNTGSSGGEALIVDGVNVTGGLPPVVDNVGSNGGVPSDDTPIDDSVGGIGGGLPPVIDGSEGVPPIDVTIPGDFGSDSSAGYIITAVYPGTLNESYNLYSEYGDTDFSEVKTILNSIGIYATLTNTKTSVSQSVALDISWDYTQLDAFTSGRQVLHGTIAATGILYGTDEPFSAVFAEGVAQTVAVTVNILPSTEGKTLLNSCDVYESPTPLIITKDASDSELLAALDALDVSVTCYDADGIAHELPVIWNISQVDTSNIINIYEAIGTPDVGDAYALKSNFYCSIRYVVLVQETNKPLLIMGLTENDDFYFPWHSDSTNISGISLWLRETDSADRTWRQLSEGMRMTDNGLYINSAVFKEYEDLTEFDFLLIYPDSEFVISRFCISSGFNGNQAGIFRESITSGDRDGGDTNGLPSASDDGSANNGASGNTNSDSDSSGSSGSSGSSSSGSSHHSGSSSSGNSVNSGASISGNQTGTAAVTNEKDSVSASDTTDTKSDSEAILGEKAQDSANLTSESMNPNPAVSEGAPTTPLLTETINSSVQPLILSEIPEALKLGSTACSNENSAKKNSILNRLNSNILSAYTAYAESARLDSGSMVGSADAAYENTPSADGVFALSGSAGTARNADKDMEILTEDVSFSDGGFPFLVFPVVLIMLIILVVLIIRDWRQQQ